MHRIDLISGISSEIFTSLHLTVSKTVENPDYEKNKLFLSFPCSSSTIAKSLQVLMLPYFNE